MSEFIEYFPRYLVPDINAGSNPQASTEVQSYHNMYRGSGMIESKFFFTPQHIVCKSPVIRGRVNFTVMSISKTSKYQSRN